MLYKQHRYIGNSVVIGKNVKIPDYPDASGIIMFAQEELIEFTDFDFFKELKRYNKSVARMEIDDFFKKVEHSALELEVRRSFGDINAWAGDHAKLYPPNGEAYKFKDLNVELQDVANTKDLEFLQLALKNWDHFMPMSFHLWSQFHREALRLARKWAREHGESPGFRKEVLPGTKTEVLVFDIDKTDLAKALFLEAYGAHFLEDCFAAGHLRTPRLLFGSLSLKPLNPMKMHDEDNDLRLEGCNGKGVKFRLCGEDPEKDDFNEMDDDPILQHLAAEATTALCIPVQQIFDVAFKGLMPGKVPYGNVRELIPILEIGWQKLAEERSRTHALEIRPIQCDPPKPLFKFHANYNRRKKKFEKPILIKRTHDGSWRRERLVSVKSFTPGKQLAWWIPDHPDKTITVP